MADPGFSSTKLAQAVARYKEIQDAFVNEYEDAPASEMATARRPFEPLPRSGTNRKEPEFSPFPQRTLADSSALNPPAESSHPRYQINSRDPSDLPLEQQNLISPSHPVSRPAVELAPVTFFSSLRISEPPSQSPSESSLEDNLDPSLGTTEMRAHNQTRPPSDDSIPDVPPQVLSESDLSPPAEDGSSARADLSDALAADDLEMVEKIVRNHFDEVAVDEFEWITDLKQAGYSTEAIVQSLKESTLNTKLDMWSRIWSVVSNTATNIDEFDIQNEIDKCCRSHQPGCIHRDKSRVDNLVHRYEESSRNNYVLTLDHLETIRETVASLCGLAGIFPPQCHTTTIGFAAFDKSTVRIEYDIAKVGTSKYYFSKFADQLYTCNHAIISSLLYLQNSGFCCDRFSVLVRDQDGAVAMRHITISDVKQFFLEVKEFKKYGQALPDISSPCNECSRRKQHCDQTNVTVLSYSQGHAGEFLPGFLETSPSKITLGGLSQGLYFQEPIAEYTYHDLACMGELIGDKVLVVEVYCPVQDSSSELFQLERGKSHGRSTLPASQYGDLSPADVRKVLVGCIEDIVDSWGPAVLFSHPDDLYGESVYSVIINGGVIQLSDIGSSAPKSIPMYHWSRFDEPRTSGSSFSIRQPLAIGAITAQSSCPLDIQKCRKLSEPFLHHLGTEADYWRLAERQAIIQGGQYVGLQVGNVYSKVKGRCLKLVLLDHWRIMSDFGILLQPWGLQVSLCTGVAKRVSLRELIQEPMLSYIDSLSIPDWDGIKLDARKAFNGEVDFKAWATGLRGPQRDCLVKVVTFFLEILKETGVDRAGKELKLLWPHESSCSYIISLQCSKSNLWTRVLKDSPSCATFAVVTGVCIEAPGHACKKKPDPVWNGQGTLLSTAVSRVSLPEAFSAGGGSGQWELQNGQQCWIERSGGDIWVYTTKEPGSEAQLKVKLNRFPKGLSIFRDWQVLRERQDFLFDAEEVVMFATMAPS